MVPKLPNPWDLGLASFGKGVFTDVTTVKGSRNKNILDLSGWALSPMTSALLGDKQERRRLRPDGDREGVM